MHGIGGVQGIWDLPTWHQRTTTTKANSEHTGEHITLLWALTGWLAELYRAVYYLWHITINARKLFNFFGKLVCHRKNKNNLNKCTNYSKLEPGET